MRVEIERNTDINRVEKFRAFSQNRKPKNRVRRLALRDTIHGNHSTKRVIRYDLEIHDIPYCIMGHIRTHTLGITWHVASQRDDYNGNEKRGKKYQDAPIKLICDINLEALQNMYARRLCTTSHSRCNDLMRLIKYELSQGDSIDKMIAETLKLTCERGYCLETKPCKKEFEK